ncbi:MAG TPA: hypothetical protein C5S51_06710 [Methanosarcinaceae archaeon]|nr:hypothetical protein [Methanosarcinaceae archaeon]
MSRQRKISLLVVLFVATVIMLPTIAGAATSIRTMPASVEPGAEFMVSVSAYDYGTISSVVETIPDGFTYVNSTLDDVTKVTEDGNTVTFYLMGQSSFDYTVTASDTDGTYIFSGVFTDVDQVEYTITDSSINVSAAGAVSASAQRLLPGSVEPSTTVTVGIIAADYGTIGSVVETIPAGFTYVNSTLDGVTKVTVDGNTVTFYLMGQSSFDYIVTAPDTNGTYTFSGVFTDEDQVESTITDSSTDVTTVPGIPASAQRSLPVSVEPDATVTVGITVADYGTIGSVVETIPAEFTYVSSTLDGVTKVTVDGNTVTFYLMGQSSFDYTVTASDTDGTYTFSGVLADEDQVESAINDSSIDVVTPPMDILLKEGWNFISIPCVLENSSIDGVLAGVSYNSPLLYYNAETSVWDTALTFEPLKGYWINVSAADQVILEDSLVKQEIQDPPAPQPQIQIYEGWNAIGSNYEYAETAEKTLMSIDAKYAKIDDGYGLIALNGEDYEDAEDGTENFIMYPYNGYWVFVTLDGVLG